MIQQPEIKIKQLRELKNYTQEHMATQLGLSTRAYSKIESGETQLTINRLNEISRILGIEPMEVLGFDHKNIFNNCTQTRTSGKFITNSKVFPINKLAIKVQIKSGLVANNIGPASI